MYLRNLRDSRARISFHNIIVVIVLNVLVLHTFHTEKEYKLMSYNYAQIASPE